MDKHIGNAAFNRRLLTGTETVRGPMGGTYNIMDFFPAMDSNWDKAARCLKPMLPQWLQNAMVGQVMSVNSVEFLDQYGAPVEGGRYIESPMKDTFDSLLQGSSRASIAVGFFKVKIKGIISFGIRFCVSQTNVSGVHFLRQFEGFINLADRMKWQIDDVPIANDRTPNDPAYLIPSKVTRQNGILELPMAMRLDMYGQFCIEHDWTAYRVLGQQLLLTVELVIKKAE